MPTCAGNGPDVTGAPPKRAPLFGGPWRFVASAPTIAALPPEGPPEVAFAGRSNVGKSSLINALTGMSALARTSNTPGRTQALNFFVPDQPGVEHVAGELPLAIVDLPGLGYAKAPKPLVAAWNRLIRQYLTGRPTLRRVFLLVDARHGLKPNDHEMLTLLDEAAVSYQIVLTKADKVRPPALEAVVADTMAAIGRRPAAHPGVMVTSSVAGAGLAEVRSEIESLQR